MEAFSDNEEEQVEIQTRIQTKKLKSSSVMFMYLTRLFQMLTFCITTALVTIPSKLVPYVLVSGFNALSDHLPELTLLQRVPDVRGAIKSTSSYFIALVLSILAWLNPKNWPKISFRRRVRRWRRRRRTRGPPTRFSARIRHMPVQFVGELPVVRRRRRPRQRPIIPAEILSVPKDVRVDRLVKEFESKVSQFNPGALTRSVSHIGNVQVFVNLIFILYARWRFVHFLFTTEARLARYSLKNLISIDFQLQFSINVARFARRNIICMDFQFYKRSSLRSQKI